MNKLRGQGKISINLIAFITLLLTAIGGGFMTGKVVQNNECNLKIQSCENEKNKSEPENTQLKVKIDELTRINESLQKPSRTNNYPETPKTLPKSKCLEKLKIYVKDAETKLPMKGLHIINGGGREFESGYTDTEGKLTIYFSQKETIKYSRILVNPSNYETLDEKTNICDNSNELITFFLQPK